MKQRITVQQLSKLSDEQKEQLRDWWNPETYDIAISHTGEDHCLDVNGNELYLVSDNEGTIPPLDKIHFLPLLSIGQMIQFIQENKPQLKGISKNRFGKWFVNIDTAQLGYKDELCDALWEATTQILKSLKKEDKSK